MTLEVVQQVFFLFRFVFYPHGTDEIFAVSCDS